MPDSTTWQAIGQKLATSALSLRNIFIVDQLRNAGDAELLADLTGRFNIAIQAACEWGSFFDAVEANPPEGLENFAESLAALKNEVLSETSWDNQFKSMKNFINENTDDAVLRQFFRHDFTEAHQQFQQNTGYQVPNAIDNLYVGKFTLSLNAAVIPEQLIVHQLEAQALIQPHLAQGTISKEAAAEFPGVYAKIIVMQALTSHLEPSIGYPYFKDWATQHQIPLYLQKELDPTEVSKQIDQFAPEA